METPQQTPPPDKPKPKPLGRPRLPLVGEKTLRPLPDKEDGGTNQDTEVE